MPLDQEAPVRRRSLLALRSRPEKDEVSPLMKPWLTPGLLALGLVAAQWSPGSRRAAAQDIGIAGLDPAAYAAEVFRLTNLERTNRGLPALQANAQLAAAALVHASYCALKHDIEPDGPGSAHIGPNGTTILQRITAAGYTAPNLWGENSAMWDPDPGQESTLLEAWMASATHRANILNPGFVDLGVAAVLDDLNPPLVFVVQDFGRRPGGGGTGPAAPSNLTAKPPARGRTPALKVKWKDNSSNENGFKLERKLGSAPDTSFATIATLGKNKKAFNDKSGLAGHTTYSYRLTAFNASGASSPALGSGTTR
jgi:uncharacterized protein YkwD